MSCFVNPVEEDQCLYVCYEGEMEPSGDSEAWREANGVLEERQWRRIVVDVTQLRSLPPSSELYDFARAFSSDRPSAKRVALVVRPEQARQAKLVEKVARHGHVFLTYFLDPERAIRWVKQTGLPAVAREWKKQQ